MENTLAHKSFKPAHAIHESHYNPKSADTLMRKAVHKPTPSIKRRVHVVGSLDSHLAKMAVVPAHKNNIHSAKHHRSSAVARSNSVSHFHKTTSEFNQHHQQAVNVHQHSQEVAAALAPDFAPPIAYGSLATASTTPRNSADVLDKALMLANAHNNPTVKPARKNARKFAATWMTAAVAVLALAVLVMQNSTNIKLQLASNKAGFSSSLPSDLPSGYSLNQLNYTRGSITTSFKSNTDQSKLYTIVQRPTEWDNKVLAQNVSKTTTDYVSETAKGITVYLYGNHNAQWLNNGILYVAQTNGTLSNNELLNIASGK
jgi:hypothetical protein